jgi:phage baseplate assembly protein W
MLNGNGDEVRSFRGSGWAFPFGTDHRGGTALVSEDEAIRRSIYLIISTAKGERRMRPHFGCAIHDLVFAPGDATTVGLIRSHVEEALGWWEPRVSVADVEVETDDEDPTRLLVTVRYVVKATKDERSLVYPFYLIPGEA